LRIFRRSRSLVPPQIPLLLPVLERVGEALALDPALGTKTLRRPARLAPLGVEHAVALVDRELGATSPRAPVRLE
jgi:hypothetical protein